MIRLLSQYIPVVAPLARSFWLMLLQPLHLAAV